MSDEKIQKRALNRVEKVVVGSKLAETIFNIFKAVLASTAIGSGIASLLTDYIPSARALRLEEFAAQTAEDLRELADEIEADYIKTDNFAFMFEKCFRGVAENPQREKIEAFRGILINSAIRKDYSEEEKEYFVNLVNNLSALHIRILGFLHSPVEYLNAAGISQNQIQGGFRQFMPIAIPGVELDVIKSAFGDLHRFGLTNTDQGIFSTMTASQGMQLLGSRVSEFGRRFMQFCISPAK
jgi:hypothetical protein